MKILDVKAVFLQSAELCFNNIIKFTERERNRKMFNNKIIFISGGTGSFGNKFVDVISKNINQK